MDPSSTPVSQILSSGLRFKYEVPPYQRKYQWGPERWMDLWTDLISLYRNEDVQQHFFGVMLAEETTKGSESNRNFKIIDGQQRLITLMVLLAAIRDSMHDEANKSLNEFDRLLYIYDPISDTPTKELVLNVQESDKDAFYGATHGQWIQWFKAGGKNNHELLPLWCYAFFRYRIFLGDDANGDYGYPPTPSSSSDLDQSPVMFWESLGIKQSDKLNLRKLYETAFNRFTLLRIVVEQSDGDAVAIYDAVNGKRTEFDQWDYVRSSLFIKLGSKADEIFKNVWSEIETNIKTSKYGSSSISTMDGFLYEYLIARGESGKQGQGTINRRRVHDQLVRRLNRISNPDFSAREFIEKDLYPASRCFSTAVSQAPAKLIARDMVSQLEDRSANRLNQIKLLSAGPPQPLLLYLVEGWWKGDLSHEQLHSMLKMTETFLARHVLSGTPLSPLRSRIMQTMHELDGAYDLEKLASLLMAQSPTDDQIRQKLVVENSAVFRTLSRAQLAAIFRGIEDSLSGGGGHLLPYGKGQNEYSVEHVYPQSCAPNPNAAWALELNHWGVTKPQIIRMGELVHTLGNLCMLTNKVNNSLRARSFALKRQAYAGDNSEIPISPMNHISSISSRQKWDSPSIIERTNLLVNAALNYWKF